MSGRREFHIELSANLTLRTDEIDSEGLDKAIEKALKRFDVSLDGWIRCLETEHNMEISQEFEGNEYSYSEEYHFKPSNIVLFDRTVSNKDKKETLKTFE